MKHSRGDLKAVGVGGPCRHERFSQPRAKRRGARWKDGMDEQGVPLSLISWQPGSFERGPECLIPAVQAAWEEGKKRKRELSGKKGEEEEDASRGRKDATNVNVIFDAFDDCLRSVDEPDFVVVCR